MALTKPILFNIPAFDAGNSQLFTFNVIGGNQVVKNTLQILNNVTLQQVYQQTQTTFKFEHTVSANLLVNGTQYQARIQTVDAQNNVSPWSDPILFWCYTTPSFSFTNLPFDTIIINSSYNFEVTYNQLQGELLNSYTMNLYEVGGTVPISSSGVQYVSSSILPTLLSYLFTGFETGAVYQIECVGITVENTAISTGRINFSVIYEKPSVFTLMALENNCSGGYITIASNIVLIKGESNPDPPIYIDDKEVDIRGEGHWIRWVEGYSIASNFTFGLWFRDANPNTKLMEFSNVNGDKFWINYREGYLDDDNTNSLQIYVELYAQDVQYDLKYYIYSNYIDIPTDSEQIFMYMRRINNIYDLTIKNRGVIV